MGTARTLLGWGTVAAALVALTGCATAVAGTGSPGEPSCLPAVAPAAPAPPSDPPTEESEAPAGRRVIAVDVGLNMWIASSHTSPLYLTVYEDGTVLRSEDAGAHDEPLPALTIGRIDDCVLDDAVARLVDLAGEDMGDPAISDQGTTRVYVWPDARGRAAHHLRVRARAGRRVRRAVHRPRPAAGCRRPSTGSPGR